MIRLKRRIVSIIGATVMIVSMMCNISNADTKIEFLQTTRVQSKTLSQILLHSGVNITEITRSPILKSSIFSLSNGAEIVINHKEGIYELFVEELQDWSVPCATYEDLLEYVELYIEHKYDYMYYDNIDLDYEEGCCSIMTTNGIEIMTTEQDKNDVYLPIFGNKLPYPCKDMEQAKDVCEVYYESLNYMNY